jgi:hypothetical protein
MSCHIAFPPVILDLLLLSRSIFGHIPQEAVRNGMKEFTYGIWKLIKQLLMPWQGLDVLVEGRGPSGQEEPLVEYVLLHSNHMACSQIL